MDFNRIGKIIRQTKDKLIVATDADLLVVMDLDSYEDLIKQNQVKTAFVAKDVLVDKIDPTIANIENDGLPGSSEGKMDSSLATSSMREQAGPVSVKDVIADRAEQAFVSPLATSSMREHAGQVDEAEEFYFEEVD